MFRLARPGGHWQGIAGQRRWERKRCARIVFVRSAVRSFNLLHRRLPACEPCEYFCAPDADAQPIEIGDTAG